MAKLPLNHIQNNEEGLSVRDKLNTVIDRINATQDIEGIVDDHKHDTSNPHKVKAPQVALEPIITPLAPNEQNVQDALEWLYGHFEQHANEGWHLDHIDGIYTVIQINRGPNTQFPPDPTDLKVGELKLDWNEGKLWTKLGDDADVIIGGKGVIFEAPLDGELYGRKVSETDPTVGDWYRITNAAGMVISDVEPSDPVEGMQWLDSTSAEVWIWDGEKWLEFPAGGSGASVQIEDRPPSDPSIGDVWTDYGTTGELYIWDGRYWVSMTGDGGPKIIVGGEGGGDIDLPENITLDNLEDDGDADKALARHISSGGVGKWLPIKTGDIETDPSVTFRDAKGRFKSTKKYEGLTDQLKVNRFLAGELESQGETLEQTNAGLVRVDNQVAENTSNIIQLQESAGNIDIPEYDDSELRALIEELPVTVSTEPPEIGKDGELWYDDERLELFVSYQDGWISTTPLTARVEAGEALQAQILARVEAGEVKQAQIDEGKIAKKGDTMKGNLAMAGHQITGLGTPKQRGHTVSKGYFDDTLEEALEPYATTAYVDEKHDANKEYADTKVALTGTNVVDTSWRLKNGGATVLSTSTSGTGKLKIYNLDYPSHPEHAANMRYVDDAVAGRQWKWHQVSNNTYGSGSIYYVDVDNTTRQFAIHSNAEKGGSIKFIPGLESENLGKELLTVSGIKDGKKTFIAIVQVRSWVMTDAYIVVRCNKADFRHWEPESFADRDLVTVEYGGLF